MTGSNRSKKFSLSKSADSADRDQCQPYLYHHHHHNHYQPHTPSHQRNVLTKPNVTPISPLSSAQSFCILLPHGHSHSLRVICIKSISLPCTFNLSFVFLTHRVYLVYSIYRFVHRRAAKGSDTALRTNSHGNAYSFLTIYEFTRILYFVHLFASLYLYFAIHIILRFYEFHKYFVFVV